MRRKMLAAALIGLTLALVASSASAGVRGRATQNAALGIVGYDSNKLAAVIVDDYFDKTVEVVGYGVSQTQYGVAWFTVRVSGVGDGALTAKAYGTGDCSGRTVTVTRKSSSIAVVKVRHTGSFDCTYKSVTVSWQ